MGQRTGWETRATLTALPPVSARSSRHKPPTSTLSPRGSKILTVRSPGFFCWPHPSGGGSVIASDEALPSGCVLDIEVFIAELPPTSIQSSRCAYADLDRNGQIQHHHIVKGASETARGAMAAMPDAATYRPALIQYFRRRTSDQDEIEDLVQDVFLRIAARRSSEVIENVAGYVFQIAASVIADRHRRRAVRHADAHVEFDTERHGDVDFDAVRILVARQSLRKAIAALHTLPERTRTIFVLRRVEGHAYRDIAVQLGISVSAVEKHMVRAVNHLVSSS